ncbi:MAG: carboxypeptidase regulatory-like domain-containing protein [Planctomycetota bacterium]
MFRAFEVDWIGFRVCLAVVSLFAAPAMADDRDIACVQYVSRNEIPVGSAFTWRDAFESIEPIRYLTPNRRLSVRGVVRSVDGLPAPNATLLLIESSRNRTVVFKRTRQPAGGVSTTQFLKRRSVIAKTKTDSQGKFGFDQVAARFVNRRGSGNYWSLCALGEDESLASQMVLELTPSDEGKQVSPIVWKSDAIDMRLRPSSGIIGRVIDKQGSPVKDVVVYVDDLFSTNGADVHKQSFSGLLIDLASLEFPTHVRTDNEGRFAFPSLPMGHVCSLNVHHEIRKFNPLQILIGDDKELSPPFDRMSVASSASGKEIVIEERADSAWSPLRLSNSFGTRKEKPVDVGGTVSLSSVRGRIVDSQSGNPISDAQICFCLTGRGDSPHRSDFTRVVKSSSDGEFLAEVPRIEGMSMVILDSTSHQSIDPRTTQGTNALERLSYRIRWLENSTTQDLGDIKIDAKPEIQVMVRDEDGMPAIGSQVSVFGLDSASKNETELCPPTLQQSAYPQSLMLSHGVSNSLLIRACSVDEYPPRMATLKLPRFDLLDPKAVYEVHLQSAAELSGEVTLDGEPLANATVVVWLRVEKGQWMAGRMTTYANARTDDDGNYRVIVAPKQVYTVSVSSVPMNIPFNRVLFKAVEKENDVYRVPAIRLERPRVDVGSITGRVTDKEGNPLSGFTVRVNGSSHGELSNPSVVVPRATTNSKGEFILEGVNPSESTIIVSPSRDLRDKFHGKSLKGVVGENLNIQVGRKLQVNTGRFLPKVESKTR